MKRPGQLAAVVLLGAACRGGSPALDGTGRALLTQTGSKDTIRFEVPVLAQRCGDGRGVVIRGAQRGEGLLLWIRTAGQSVDTGRYPLLTRGDSVTARGAIAAVRFAVGPVSHGLTIDDGAATVSQTTPTLSVAVSGHGIEQAPGSQRAAELSFTRVVLAPDTASCRAQP
jgi:hypothetical protein